MFCSFQRAARFTSKDDFLEQKEKKNEENGEERKETVKSWDIESHMSLQSPNYFSRETPCEWSNCTLFSTAEKKASFPNTFGFFALKRED